MRILTKALIRNKYHEPEVIRGKISMCFQLLSAMSASRLVQRSYIKMGALLVTKTRECHAQHVQDLAARGAP